MADLPRNEAAFEPIRDKCRCGHETTRLVLPGALSTVARYKRCYRCAAEEYRRKQSRLAQLRLRAEVIH